MSDYFYVINCATTNVTTSSYVDIVASTPVSTSKIQFVYFNPAGMASGLLLAKLAMGAEGFEEDFCVCSQQNAIPVDTFIWQNVRLSVQAIGLNITSGYLILCLLP